MDCVSAQSQAAGNLLFAVAGQQTLERLSHSGRQVRHLREGDATDGNLAANSCLYQAAQVGYELPPVLNRIGLI